MHIPLTTPCLQKIMNNTLIQNTQSNIFTSIEMILPLGSYINAVRISSSLSFHVPFLSGSDGASFKTGTF